MSYILDALKQSEHRRTRQTPTKGVVIQAAFPAAEPAPRYRHRLWWRLACLLLALMLGYGLGNIGSNWLQPPPLATRVPGPSAGSAPPEETTPAQPTSTRVTTTTSIPIVMDSAPVRILLEEPPALIIQPPPGARTAAAPAPVIGSPRPMIPPTPVSTPEPGFDPGVPDLRELPASIRAKLPTLMLSVHIYSATASNRMASINGQMLREGQQLGALRLESITPRGVILNIEGQEFHLKSVGE
ncbi:general secretion pathway protein GspB [Oceanisphaera sp.]|uniref:general secretion pathway protein GspB n=1 Tax=Oceanisphaera sp. TaxID=1929979 RepID=UPI003A946B94